jgi:hypothetical protein
MIGTHRRGEVFGGNHIREGTMRRLLTVAAIAAAISIPTSIATVGVTGPAFAASGISCTSLKGSDSGTVTIGKCTPSGGKGYKTASGTAATLATGGNITWKKSGATTTVGDTSVNSPGQGGCKKGSSEYDFSGKVTGASTTGTGIPAVGDAVSARACVSKTGSLSLVKGTSMSL